LRCLGNATINPKNILADSRNGWTGIACDVKTSGAERKKNATPMYLKIVKNVPDLVHNVAVEHIIIILYIICLHFLVIYNKHWTFEKCFK